MFGFGAGFAVAGALPPGPTVDVQVEPLAYGGDPAAGTPPELFGLGVGQAHCSGGATAYTLGVNGGTYRLPCANGSGTRPRTVTLGLSPGQRYTVTIKALKARADRTARAGSTRTLTVEIPAAKSKDWKAGP